MPFIHVLDEATINQIAAGEVVERPSAVVKELIENAMDAGATAITAEIKEGGLSFIRITDNGLGIAKEDIPLAFLRHATSKIRKAEDLLSVTSLGFRGEALSSIASVAQVELITKTPTALNGFRYLIEGGEEKVFEEIGSPSGTTIIVRNIFFNTPARRKFLKSAMTETGYISDLMERLIVSHPNVSFKFIVSNQVKLQSSGNNNCKDILYHIYGRDISKELLLVDHNQNDVKITGYIGKPIITRGNRNFENYFINGRYIKSNIITKAIEEAYKPFMMQHKYPFTSMYFEIDPSMIDVNVHPQKMEIRLKNGEEIYQLTYNLIRNTLSGKEMIPKVHLMVEQENKSDSFRMPEPFEQNRRKELGGNSTTYGKEKDQSYHRVAEKSTDYITATKPLINATGPITEAMIGIKNAKPFLPTNPSEERIGIQSINPVISKEDDFQNKRITAGSSDQELILAVNKISNSVNNNDTGNNDTGNNDTGNNDTGNNDTGSNNKGNNNTGSNNTGNNDTGNNNTGNNDTGNNDISNNGTSNNVTSNNGTSNNGTSNNVTSNNGTSNNGTSNNDISNNDISNNDTSNNVTSNNDTTNNGATINNTTDNDTTINNTSNNNITNNKLINTNYGNENNTLISTNSTTITNEFSNIANNANTDSVSDNSPSNQKIVSTEQMKLFSDEATTNDSLFLSKKALEEHRIIGQVFATYWLVEYKKELYIIDQHAAHEKVLYEKIMNAAKSKTYESQQLLPPIILSLTLKEQEVLHKYESLLNSLGYEFEHFGGKEYSVRAVPADLYSISEKELLLEFIDEMADEMPGNAANSNAILERVASLSCKAAVKANHNLSYEEAAALIKELLTLENPYHCPHGRPVIVSMSQYELERKFKRIV